MKKSYKPYAASAALALSLSLPASADIFIDIDGIEGDSQDANFKGEIDVIAWAWGLSNSGTTHNGSTTSSGSGKANFQDISLTKKMDIAGKLLYTRIAIGNNIAKATLTVTRPGQTSNGNILSTLLLENILVTSASLGSNADGDVPTENITLNFSKFTINNYQVDPNTGVTIPGNPFCWDIPTSKVC